jgi:PTS system fructose-specific IIC component
MKFVAVTSCPTGIAHTYMAAEALEQAAAESGDEMHVETQGSAGADPLDQGVIDGADAVIFAADVEVRGRERFAGKPLVQSGVKRAIGGAAQMLDEARAAAAAAPAGGGAAGAAGAGATAAGTSGGGTSGGGLATKVDSGAGFGSRLRQWLMTGVSYVIPFVAAGGLLIALSFALGGYQIVDAPPVTEGFSWGSLQSWAALMFQIGGIAFGFLVPILAGFIAFAMADRPALVPGIVGGAIATQVPSEDAPAGFLGGLVAGLLAGAVVLLIRRVKVPRAVAGIMPVVVIPLLATLIVGFLMFVVLGPPIGALTAGLTGWLNGLSGANRVLLGILLGLMMAFDMGGPINKTAYAFAVAGLSTQTETSFQIMAAVMAAGMTPPLGMALATVIRKRLFSNVEQENGKAAWVLGASFITEGAIPFAAGDPLRVIPSLMAGSAVTGALSMAFSATSRAPHGGVFVVPLIGNPFLYLIAIVIGTVVTAVLVVTLKSLRRTPEDAADEVPATRAAAAA